MSFVFKLKITNLATCCYHGLVIIDCFFDTNSDKQEAVESYDVFTQKAKIRLTLLK